MAGSEVSGSDKEGEDKPSEGRGRIQRSLESMLEQMQVSDNEKKYRMENFDNVDVVKEYFKYLRCTKCNLNFQRIIKSGDPVGIHPLLGVLMCDSCCDYYGDGNFSLDSEGEDKYCRWCGEGGTIFACSKCICGFCDVCIKKHFGEKGLEAVKNDDDWICYFCNPEPLWYLRSICFLAKEAAQNKRDHLKKGKEGSSVKRKRRKIEIIENDFKRTSSDSCSNSSSNSKSSSTTKRRPRRKRLLEKVNRDESSSSEDEKENHVNSRKRIFRSKKRSVERDLKEESSESDSNKKKSKNTIDEIEFENKKTLVLQKLKSIWRLTQTITEVGLSSSRDKLKNLSKPERYNSVEHLKREHEDLKSCMNVLVSSLNSASNSVNSITEDLTIDTTKDETESFRSQEIRLKTFADEFHERSGDRASIDSEEDAFRKELKQSEGGKKQPVRGTRKSVRQTVKKKNSEKNINLEKNSGGANKSKSFSESGSDEGDKKRDSRERAVKENEVKGNRDKSEESGLVKPLLKVKSFARMLDENVYDKNNMARSTARSPVVIDLYDIDTDESESENRKKNSLDCERKTAVKNPTSEGERKSGKQLNCLNGEEGERTSSKEENKGGGKVENLENSEENEAKNKKSCSGSEEESSEKQTRNKSVEKEKCSANGETENERSGDEDRRSSGRVDGNEGAENRIEGERKRDGANDDENKKSSGNEKVNSSVIESGEKEKVSPGTQKGETQQKPKQLVDDESENENVKKKETIESEGEEDKERKDEKKVQSADESRDKKGSSEEENGKAIESETDNDDDDVECKTENRERSKADEIGDSKDQRSEESEGEGQPKVSNDEDEKEKEVKITASGDESEGEKELSDNEEKREEVPSNDKNDSSDSEGKKSSDGEKGTRRKRKQTKEIKSLFEKFKRKRERYLKSCRENSQSETDKEEAKTTKFLESSESETEKRETEKKVGRQKKKRLLASSDEENEGTEGKGKETTSSEESAKEDQDQESELEEVKPSTGETSSDGEGDGKQRKRIRKRNKCSSDSSQEENERKKKKQESSSESSEDEKSKKRKKGRKNIKKILKKDSLQVETKEALKNEEDRKKRLKERQKLFEELFPQGEDDTPKQLILDFNPETKEPLVSVHKKLVKKLKPHQVKGVKFMWDSCFESVQKLEEESGSGCILSHCMGLGKTFQVITLVHTVMTHDLGVNTVMIVCPLSTISNWIREFESWLGNIKTDSITLYDLVKYKRPEERTFYLEQWQENGGVLILSYDLFRTLTRGKVRKEKGKKAKFQQVFEKTLLDPGPDLVICDEGHLLKNEETALSKCMNRVKTSRRIILTGTPLQNNLIEYHCMVQFVKPNILGTKKEFCNQFVNPINNGQFEDSTELDVKIMKRRSHVLHSMLDGCIQRFDYSVLTAFLPEKHEYVLSIAMTEAQSKAYIHFINNLSAKSSGSSRVAGLFCDYHSLQKIWTHPRTMLMHREREIQKEEDVDSERSLKDFVVSSEEETSRSGSESSDDSVQEVPPRKRILRSNANDPEVKKAIEEEEKLLNKHWWNDFYEEKAYDDLRESNKLKILFSLVKYCGQKKDKLLVFSQSLYSLDLIEYFLSRINENRRNDDETLCGHRDTWILGRDYFRLDGSTSSETRTVWCKYFNRESNTRARLFLISTKAGGLGINLYGANRVVIFDVSWNPSDDLQSIFRVYRFGQKKTCYIYRFLSEATMEEKIYERQVTKLSLAHRVVDEYQIERHYTMGNLQELYTFQPTPKKDRKVPKLPKDSVLADIFAEYKDIVVGYHEHDSLLENKHEEELSEEERKAAWKEYEEEKLRKEAKFPTMDPQLMLMQQGQFSQDGAGMQVLNSGIQMNSGQTFINPIYLQSNIPLDALQRGMQIGVNPLPGESFEAYLIRVFNRETWMQVRQAQGQ